MRSLTTKYDMIILSKRVLAFLFVFCKRWVCSATHQHGGSKFWIFWRENRQTLKFRYIFRENQGNSVQICTWIALEMFWFQNLLLIWGNFAYWCSSNFVSKTICTALPDCGRWFGVFQIDDLAEKFCSRRESQLCK